MPIDPELISKALVENRNIRIAMESMERLTSTLEPLLVQLLLDARLDSQSSDTDGESTSERIEGQDATPNDTPPDISDTTVHAIDKMFPALFIRGYTRNRGKTSYFAFEVRNYYELFDFIKRWTSHEGLSVTFTHISYVVRT